MNALYYLFLLLTVVVAQKPAVVVIKKETKLEATVKCKGEGLWIQELGGFQGRAFCFENRLILDNVYVGDGRYTFYCGSINQLKTIFVTFVYGPGDDTFMVNCFVSPNLSYSSLKLSVRPEENVSNQQRDVTKLGNETYISSLPLDIDLLPPGKSFLSRNYVWKRVMVNDTKGMEDSFKVSWENISVWVLATLALILSVTVFCILVMFFKLMPRMKTLKRNRRCEDVDDTDILHNSARG